MEIHSYNIAILLKLFIQDLKDVLANLIPDEQKRVRAFRSQHGNTKVGEVTVDMVCNDINTYL